MNRAGAILYWESFLSEMGDLRTQYNNREDVIEMLDEQEEAVTIALDFLKQDECENCANGDN